MKNNRSKYIDFVIIILTIALFIGVKLDGLSWRFGDGNAYFYMANQILKGQIPYRDFLLADPPLLVFILAGVKHLIGQKIILLQWLPIVLEATTAGLLFIISKPKLPKLAKFIPAVYLFSFLILATSDYVTGLHFVNLFVVLAVIFKKKPLASGFLWALATSTKLYVIPGFIGWFLWLLMNDGKKNKQLLIKTAASYIVTGLVSILPFLLIAPQKVVNYLLVHQFNRPPGINKLRIFSFFLIHDITLITATLTTFIVQLKIKHKISSLLPIFLWLSFFIIFQDLYYLYLAVMAPWMLLTFIDLLTIIKQSSLAFIQQHSQQLSTMIMLAVFLAQIVAVLAYRNSIQSQGMFEQLPTVADYVTRLDPKPLFGSHEVAPLVALKSNLSLFDNHIDTNAQLFDSGVINKQKISQQAAQKGVYLLVKVANIAENKNVDQGYEKYFSQETFKQACQQLAIFDGNDSELFDDVAIYNCQLP